MQIVAGQKTEVKQKSEIVVAMLRQMADAIESGGESATEGMVLIKDSSDIETAYTNYVYTGRSTEMLGLMEYIKFRIITEDMVGGGVI